MKTLQKTLFPFAVIALLVTGATASAQEHDAAGNIISPTGVVEERDAAEADIKPEVRKTILERALDAKPTTLLRRDAAGNVIGDTENIEERRKLEEARREHVDEATSRLRAEASETGIRPETTREREEIREDALEKREAREEMSDEERAEERKKEALRKRAELIKAYVVRTEKRIVAAGERLETLSERIGSRIEKFEERGVDMTESQLLLIIADDAISSAKESMLGLGDFGEKLAESIEAGETPNEIIALLREEVKEAVTAIKSAHAALVDVIESLKASIPTDENEEGSDDEDEDDDEEEEDDDDSDEDNEEAENDDDTSDETNE